MVETRGSRRTQHEDNQKGEEEKTMRDYELTEFEQTHPLLFARLRAELKREVELEVRMTPPPETAKRTDLVDAVFVSMEPWWDATNSSKAKSWDTPRKIPGRPGNYVNNRMYKIHPSHLERQYWRKPRPSDYENLKLLKGR